MGFIQDQNNTSAFYRTLNNSIKGLDSSQRTIFTGVVIEMFPYGPERVEKGRRLAPGTLKLYINQLDSTDKKEQLSFYEPFLPIHLMALPEVGEEVLVIFDSLDRIKGYWVSRNDSIKVNKSDVNAIMGNNADMSAKVGTDILDEDNDYYIYKPNDISPNEKMKIPSFRKKDGDVYMQGRSNTLILQSFSKDSKEGIVDIASGLQGSVMNDDTDYSEIRYREFLDAKSRILLSTKYNIDKNEDWDLTTKPGFMGKPSNSKDSYILMRTGEFRFVSDKSSEKLNNAVLGNKQEEWLKQLIDILNKLVNAVTQTVIVQCGPAGSPNAVNYIATAIPTLTSELNALKETISNHHSKTNFLN